MNKKRIIFVCTGNFFRSVAASYSFKKYLKVHNIKGFIVDSAGTIGKQRPMVKVTGNALNDFGINVWKHIPKKLTKKLVNENDLIVVMGKNHKDFIKKKFGVDAVLFNKIAIGKNTGILDVNEINPNYRKDRNEAFGYVRKTISLIHGLIPKFYKNVRKFV